MLMGLRYFKVPRSLGSDRFAFGIAVVIRKRFHQIIGDLLTGVAPKFDQVGVALLFGDGTLTILLLDDVGFFLAGFEDGRFAVGGCGCR